MYKLIRNNTQFKGGDLSIITPVYNRADCIRRCVESVIRNLSTDFAIEHIIVDDGSKDKTPEIVKGYTDRYDHIRFIAFPENRGTNAARNAAISIATGDYCIILDSDDYFVDDALQTIHKTMMCSAGYKHYLFVPDDMLPQLSANRLLKGHDRRVLTFVDFLMGCFGGDFIHVVNTEIMQKYPFDESLRIHEGVFFMRFYKAAQKILFTNKIITIRERSREDSVTREVLRTNIAVIERTLKANRLYIEWFGDDYRTFGLIDRLTKHYYALADNYLLLGQYKEAKECFDFLGSAVSMRHKIVYNLRIGKIYRVVIRLYLIFKYNILKKRLG